MDTWPPWSNCGSTSQLKLTSTFEKCDVDVTDQDHEDSAGEIGAGREMQRMVQKDLWVLEDKNDMGSVFDWIVDFSVLCLYSLYLFLLILICFRFFFYLLSMNLSGRDKHLYYQLSRQFTLFPMQIFFFYYFFSFNIYLL